jgi:mRNA-degrading endonuclease toxin of MazEF toxin-antitoxin module
VAVRRGYLHWVHVDKRRPALVLSPDARNERATDVIVVPCSTRVRPSPTHVFLRAGEGGVPAESVLKCEQITTLHRDDVDDEPIGRALARKRMGEVERAVLRAIGVPVPLE